MGRTPTNPQRAANIARNCERAARLMNELRAIRLENEKLEWADHVERTGNVTCLDSWRNRQRFRIHHQSFDCNRAA